MSLHRRLINKAHRLVAPYYHRLGSQFCPVCGHSVMAFTPLSPQFRANWKTYGFDLDLNRFETINMDHYHCPLCTVSDRDRLYALYFEQLIAAKKPPSHGRFLEFAPIGPLTAKLKSLFKGWEYRTADLMMAGVDDQVDICDMRAVYPDASVDLFLCSHVLEHVPDDQMALAELFRILKPGGSGILMVPIHLDLRVSREGGAELSTAERWQQFAQDDHLRLHSKPDWQQRISTAGFTLSELPASTFGPERCTQLGISLQSILYVVQKPL